ncbi:MAG: InlB B-repeat-containing protein, partial [Bacillota bacterium]|nr:InlB B-repeat-containing protein [Bacillota bacterium]
MKRILAIMLVVILVLSSFTFAFANNESGGGGFNIGIDGPFSITLEEGECKTVNVTINGSGSNNKEEGLTIIYPTEIEINGSNISIKDSDSYDFYDNSKSFTFNLKICALSGSESIEIDLFDGLDPSVPEQQNGTYITLGDRVGLKGNDSGKLNITVTEPPTKYTVTLNALPSEGGTVSGAGNYKAGDTVTVTASTNLGYTFEGWIENTNIAEGDQTSSSFTFIMPEGNVEYTANFKDIIAPPPIEFYQLTLVSNPVGTGLLTGGGTYPASHPVPISATPENGFNFTNWTDEDGDEVSDIDGFVYTMPAEDVTLTANFKADDETDPTYTLVLDASPTEGGIVEGAGDYKVGDTVTVTASTNLGYTFEGWIENTNI